jgi:hypothetical protein
MHLKEVIPEKLEFQGTWFSRVTLFGGILSLKHVWIFEICRKKPDF